MGKNHLDNEFYTLAEDVKKYLILYLTNMNIIILFRLIILIVSLWNIASKTI